jgi:hypothetical protein
MTYRFPTILSKTKIISIGRFIDLSLDILLSIKKGCQLLKEFRPLKREAFSSYYWDYSNVRTFLQFRSIWEVFEARGISQLKYVYRVFLVFINYR